MKTRLQEGRDRGVIHIQPLGENSVAGVTLAVVLGGVEEDVENFIAARTSAPRACTG